MQRDVAEKISDAALTAIEALSAVLNAGNDYEEYGQIKKAVGLSIGRIQMEILEPLYRYYPDLDSLADK